MRITVNRNSGDNFKDDITDPLLSSLLALLARGKQEMDAGLGLLPVQLESIFNSSAQTGQLIQVHDALDASVWKGVVTGVRFTLSDSKPLTMTQGVLRHEPTD